jgi:N-acetylgalactosamine-N,N'-diacetylbacillosaminyl-diphospho-undecaprenol 4-alpha-N-acetylgalactosaminyltransferase
MKKNISILCHSMGGGGAERFITYLIEGLSAEYNIHLLLLERRIEYKLPDNITISYLEDEKLNERANIVNILRLPLVFGRLKKYCKENSIEVVISFLNRPNYVACFLKIFGFKGKLIINEQQNSLFWYRYGFFRKIIGNLLVSKLYPRADAIVPNSEGIKFLLEEEYGIKSNFYVTKNIIDHSKINLVKDEEVVDVIFDKFTFVYASRIYDGKGHKVLLETVAEMKDVDFQLLILGKGELESYLKDYAIELGISDKVKFLGFQNNPFKYLTRSNCFVMTSESEGSPNVLVEAMACGLPIISTDCLTGPRELLAPETHPLKQVTDSFQIADFGILVPVGDKTSLIEAMLKMMEDAQLANKFKQLGFERTLDYAAEKVIPKYKAFLKNILN